VKRLFGWIVAGFFLGVLALRLMTWNAPAREGWWIVGTTSSLGALVVRLSSSDSGLLRNQITTRMLLLEPGIEPLEHRAQGLQQPELPFLSTDMDHLSVDKEGWNLSVSGGSSVSARVQVLRQAPCGDQPGGKGAGRLSGVLRYGNLEGEGDVRRVQGWGVVVHTHARGRVHNRALYVLDAGFSAGVDPLADCPAWWNSADGTVWSGEPPDVPGGEHFELQLGGKWLQVRVGRVSTLDAFGHLLSMERVVSSLAGLPPPILGIRRAIASVDGQAHAAILLERGEEGDEDEESAD
jgi:hypothetical protein